MALDSRKIRILLTGGTGSFGLGFTKYLLDNLYCYIRIFSRNEHKQFEMRKNISNDKVSFFIGDIRDKERLKRVMDGVDWVIHAAALKQAPLGEIEPQEFVKTNIIGSMNVIESALDCNVEKCLLISTDKAVEPFNLYGGTKFCSEKMFLQADKLKDLSNRKTLFSITRYGNVAGTSGSFVQKLALLKPEQPTIIYDAEATRFWITLDEACKFVLDSLLGMKGGEVFIPNYMYSVRVIDIATALRPDSKIVVVGPREGDKQHEVLSLNPRRSSDNNNFLTVEEIRNYANSII